MTQPLNVRIAELEGWTNIVPSRSALAPSPFVGDDPKGERRYLPDWPGDLNLMHELIARLNDHELENYQWALIEVVLVDYKRRDYQPSLYNPHETFYLDIGGALDRFITPGRFQSLLEATAAQKAEAYCRVKEKKDA